MVTSSTVTVGLTGRALRTHDNVTILVAHIDTCNVCFIYTTRAHRYISSMRYVPYH